MSKVLFDSLPSAVVVWGVLAMGGVYGWAYYPLLAMAFASGVYELSRNRDAIRQERVIAGILIVLVAAIALQLAPLPLAIRTALSPATESILAGYEIGHATGEVASHPLSIDPGATRVALTFAVALSVFLLGLIVRFQRRGFDDLVMTIVVLGAVVAVAALVQRASGTETIYGFWRPSENTAVPYGPFVNRNHFAGWMLMAMPFIVGYGLARARQSQLPADRRARLVWLGSRDASVLILVGAVVAVMGLAFALSLSRSGAVILLLMTCGGCAALAASRARGRTIGVAYAIFFIAVAFGWGGTARLRERFADAGRGMTARVAVWQDAVRVAEQFPLAGTGLNTYGTAMLFFQSAGTTGHYRQAHNDYLQVAAEGGILVAVPAVTLLIALAWRVTTQAKRSGFEAQAAGAVVGVIAILLQETVEFSLQMPGNAVLFCALCAAAVSGRRSAASPEVADRGGKRRVACYHERAGSGLPMRECPSCRSPNIHRSRTKSAWENWRKSVGSKRLFRCHACGWRGWGIDMGPLFSPDAVRVASPSPDVTASGEGARRDFDPRELDALPVDPGDR